MTVPEDAQSQVSPRLRILETARTLFYEEGIHSVGIDRIVSESGHPRATLYRHFRGKEALVVAYLQSEDQLVRASCNSIDPALDAKGRLLVIVTGIAKDAIKHHRRGCPFINAAAEYPDAASPVREAVTAHRTWFRSALEDAFRAVGRPDPAEDADALVLLRDAVLVGSYLDDAGRAQRAFSAAVRAGFGLLIET